MATILNEILKDIPPEGKISESTFEGANIILYTKSKDFFLDNKGVIRNIVSKIKKRIELRPDPSLCLEIEKAETAIKKIIPKEAKINTILFDTPRSVVLIEAEKPGLAIGKQGELLREIKKKTLWVPTIARSPTLQSKIIENIRSVLFQNNDYRKKFLHKVGQRIYNGWQHEKKHEWVRITFLGAARQVGRSCLFLQTPESRILLDCGVNVGATDQEQYPLVDAPEFKIEELDAIIVTHSHIDHMGFIPYLYKMGYRGPVYCTAPTRDVSALLLLDYIGVAFKQAKKGLFDVNDVREMVKHTICLGYEEVTDITPDVRITLYNAGHVLGSSMIHLHIGNGLHNLLYSLDHKTPVTVMDANNNVSFTPIGELIDNLFKTSSELVLHKNGFEELPNVKELKTIVFNQKTLKTDVKPITSFIRHPIHEDLYEITTTSGRKATVTKSHSVFTAAHGNVKSIKVSDLLKGDFIIAPKKIPFHEKVPPINLMQHMPHLRVAIDDEILLDRILASHQKKIQSLPNAIDKQEASQWVYEHFKYGSYKNDIAKKYHVHVRRINRVFKYLKIKDHPRVGHALPHIFIIDKDFARFLGYYIAEGDTRKQSQTIAISNTSSKILHDCYDIIKKTFGIEGDLRVKDDVILFHSKQLKYLLSNILHCGENAYTKRVPKEILLSQKEIIRNLLHGYFSGDGGIRVRNESRDLSFSSKNKLLVQDITFLLLQFGIVPTLKHNKSTQMYQGTLYNAQKISTFLQEIGMKNAKVPLLQHAITSMIKRKSSFDLRIPKLALSKKAQLYLGKTSWKGALTCGIPILKEKETILSEEDKILINSDLFLDQIASIKKVKPTSKYVYDLKVEGFENFLGGEGFLFLHNTGDMKFLRTQLLEPAHTKFPRLETVIIESTYGGKDNILPSRKSAEAEILKVIDTAVKRKGKVLIPVLGVGRAQEVMLFLEEAIRLGKLQNIPIYVQGMVWDVTAIHTAYPDYLNKFVKKSIFHKDQNPFLSDCFKKVASRKEQDAVVDGGPSIILATAGMLNAGASVEYFKKLADNPKNAVVFVNYLGEGTVGRRVQNGEKQVQFPGDKEMIDVNCTIATVTALTGHAGRNELVRFIHSLNPKPKKVIINHGESSRCLDLSTSLHKLARVETVAPKNLETIRLR